MELSEISMSSIELTKFSLKKLNETMELSINTISQTLKKIGFSKCPTKLIPSFLIKVLGIFNKDMRLTYMMIKKGSFEVDISKTISIFNWTPIPLEKTLLDMTKSFE